MEIQQVVGCTLFTYLKLPLLNSKEHTFACFISSSAISIRFLRKAVILFCLKLINSVGRKHKHRWEMYKVMTEASVMPFVFHTVQL